MIRFFTILGTACFVGGIAAIVIDSDEYAALGGLSILLSFAIGGVLGIRRAYYAARGIASDAKAFLSGDVQHVRVLEVSEPKGFFSPQSTIVLELEGEDGNRHQIDRDVPFPWPWALAYRMSKRFSRSRTPDLREVLATRLTREGRTVTVGRGAE